MQISLSDQYSIKTGVECYSERELVSAETDRGLEAYPLSHPSPGPCYPCTTSSLLCNAQAHCRARPLRRVTLGRNASDLHRHDLGYLTHTVYLAETRCDFRVNFGN